MIQLRTLPTLALPTRYRIRHRLARGGWQAWVEVEVPTRLDALDMARMRWPAARAWECRA